MTRAVSRLASAAARAKGVRGLVRSAAAACCCCLTLAASPSLAERCPGEPGIDPTPRVSGWGVDVHNHRFIPEARAGIGRDNVGRLSLRWVFALPETQAPRFMPLLTPDTVLITDGEGVVYALDRSSGCEKWRSDVGSTVRTAITHVPHGEDDFVAVGTITGDLVLLDLVTGAEQWRVMAGDHPRAMLSGSPVHHDGVVYQPVSSWEVGWAANPFYGCCTFRGSVVAVGVADGEIRWRARTIDEEPAVSRERWLLPDDVGPSGAPVWSQPTLDLDRGRFYVGTGQNYSAPVTDTSDAIIAFDLASGERAWSWQYTADDAWTIACAVQWHPNCPPEPGEDLDFGAPPILVRAGDRDIVLAGQKSGRVFALDPDRGGELLWAAKPGAGGKAGGVHFGMAADVRRGALYVPISDRSLSDLIGSSHDGEPSPGLYALDILTGETLWATPAPGDCTRVDDDGQRRPVDNCHPGFSAAITVTENLVFAPSLDGVLRAFDAADGRELWAYDTLGEHPAVNGEEATGGAIDLGGVFVDNGELFVSSGYGQFEQLPGNAFMVFAVDEAAPHSAGESR